MKSICLLGSTGSIGTQTLDVVARYPDKFKVVSLACNNSIDTLVNQIREFSPALVSVGSLKARDDLVERLKKESLPLPEIFVGEEGLIKLAEAESDLVVNALVGMKGLLPTLAAIEKGRDIALANKETLVAGGHLVMERVREKGVKLLPIDSEHSAIFQSLEGNKGKGIKRILLTASGGPFRGYSLEELKKVTPEMALKHPNWVMGKKITIDSATMMNKGLEIIEAKWLFDVPVDSIEVLIHPQSIVHSGVEFEDTAVITELGTPDMRVPISVALAYPHRLKLDIENLDFFGKASELTFLEPDRDVFKTLDIAVESSKKGGAYPAVMNGANEALVEAFLNNEIGFTDIQDIIAETLERHITNSEPDLESVLEADKWARETAKEIIKERRENK